MKKIITILFIIIIVICFLSSLEVSAKEDRGVFVSYIELGNFKGLSKTRAKKEIDNMIKNIKSIKLNMIVLQVRSFSDSFYYSSIFPSSYVLGREGVNYSIDLLDYISKSCIKNKIKLFVWINPYRVRGVNDVSSITRLNPAYKYIGSDYLYINNGIFYNPSKKEIEDLIVSGIDEILKKYKVDGVLFDDYFYPDKYASNNDYLEYSKTHNITIEEYNFSIITRLIKRSHDVCMKHKVLFGISMDGNVDNNLNKHFLDIETIIKKRYVDFIMPQIYYGFFNNHSFYNSIKEWEKLNNNLSLYVALAMYKVGMIDNYARNGINEWVNDNNIIMRQIILSRNLKNYKGFSVFRYGNLFYPNLFTDNSVMEIKNMKKVLK